MSISSSAVLVELNISVWTANKLDRDATDVVISNNSANSDAVKVHKNLMAGTNKRKQIADFASRTRLYHNQNTLAWSDKGARLLPTSLFMDYKTHMNAWRTKFDSMVDEFIANYDILIQQAQSNLGNLFNPSDYPSKEELRSKFGFKLVFSPLPESGDFRLDIPNTDIAELRKTYDAEYSDRLQSAMQDVWEKLHSMLIHMSDKLTDVEGADEDDKATKKRYHDTLLTNAQEMCGMLTHLNVTNDKKLEEARRDLERTLMGVDIEDVREYPSKRKEVKAKVDAILSKFDW